MADGAWYPSRDAYFAELTEDRPIFQGDIFRGVPTVFVAHPAAREAAFAELPPPSPQEAERPMTAEDVAEGVVVRGPRAMVLPHPCDFSDEEKGAKHSVRLVARPPPDRRDTVRTEAGRAWADSSHGLGAGCRGG